MSAGQLLRALLVKVPLCEFMSKKYMYFLDGGDSSEPALTLEWIMSNY